MDKNILRNAALNSSQFIREKNYWLEKLSGGSEKCRLPYDYAGLGSFGIKSDTVRINIPDEINSKLLHLSNGSDIRLFVVIVAWLKVLLYKYIGSEDIVLGAPVYRQESEEEFINTVLVLRDRLDGAMTFKELLTKVRQTVNEANEHQNCPLEQLVQQLHTDASQDGFSMFDIAVSLRNIHDRSYIQHLKPDVVFDFTREGEEIKGLIEYNSLLFKKSTIEGIAGHLTNLIKVILEDINIPICDAEMLSKEEIRQIMEDFNNTGGEYPEDKTINQLFEEQVAKTPEQVAVVFEGQRLTYRELNRKANQLARVLREKGIKPDNIVGIMVHRSIEMVTAVLGVLKAGGAYLPIDPEYPSERLKYILEDSGTKLLITQKNLLDRVEFLGEILNLDEFDMCLTDESNQERVNNSNSLAYVIYTSGSTGNPKGVMVEHKGMANLREYFINSLAVKSDDRVLQFASSSFDASVWEIFMAVLTGASLYIIPKEKIENVRAFEEYINENKITVATLPPPYMANIDVSRVLCLKKLVSAGSEMNPGLCDRWKGHLSLINAYGPTEDTICSTVLACDKENEFVKNRIPIGKPIINKSVYILDKHNRLQPVGVPGELCLSGAGVARGYLNRPELTSEKFIENPFNPGQKLYRTGDMARWLPDGNIDFMGRIDHQVKVRGFRIEPGEVENSLLRHAGVKEALVVTGEDSQGNSYLAAYITGERKLHVAELRECLSKELPDYMIPSYFIQLDHMPMTPSGKIDRRNLPQPNGIVTETEYEAPSDVVEEALVEIWKDILGIERIGVNDNFFELGGHSLRATTLVSWIHKKFNVELILREIFLKPTIKELAKQIKEAEESSFCDIQKVAQREHYPVSSMQKRMYILNRFDAKNISYNIPGAVVMEGSLDREKLERVFKALIKRHETLRTSFEMVDGEPVQKIHQDVEFDMSYAEADEDRVKEIVKAFVMPFDMGKAPLFRVKLLKMEEKNHVLLFDMHHIIADATSMGIFMRELTMLYNGQELTELKIQYKEFAAWQNELLNTEKMKKQEEYWLGRFAEEPPMLNMPLDYQRPSIQSFEGDSIYFGVGSELTGKLKKLAAETGATLFMVLLSAYNILLYKYTGQEDVVVGSPIAGRSHADLQNIIGMFLNTLAMRNFPQSGKMYSEFLNEVKENAMGAYENQSYQFEGLVDKLDLRRDLSRNPLFDTMFVLQNTDNAEMLLTGLKLSPYRVDNKTAKFDLMLTAVEMDEDISFSLEYSTKLFKKESMEKMAGHFINILKNIIKDTGVKLSEIDMITEAERTQILEGFNGTYEEYHKDKTIHQLFEEQVERTPDNVALIFGDNQLTYMELNEKSNQLAGLLRDKGVKPDSIVGIMLERSIEMIVAILGILKAGGACLPLDAEYPQNRILSMVSDSGAVLLISTDSTIKGSLTSELKEICEIVHIDKINEQIKDRPLKNLDSVSKPDNLLYVIYTSGSTGKPKGVMLENKNLVNLLSFEYMKTEINFQGKVLQFAPIGFDVSFQEIFSTLLMGGQLHLIENEKRTNVIQLLEYIKEEEMEVIFFPTVFLNYLSSEKEYLKKISKSVRHIIVAGEQLIISEELKKCLEDNNIVLHNHYGPSETHVVTTYTMNPHMYIPNIPPIGRPISNTSIYILDREKRLQPVGIVGELYISGDSVGRGYLNKDNLTAEKYITDQFNPGNTMYRTGDLARWLPDGNIEFLGRMDNQVKIRGFRIEIGEVESCLLKQESVREVVVGFRDDNEGNKNLCAYIVAERELTVKELKEHLLSELPEYMIPSYFVQLDKFPLTPNGKINRKVLPEPENNINTGVEYVVPGTHLEKTIADIWKEVLKKDNIGINDNLFDIGGNSLTVLRINSLINQRLMFDNLQEISVTLLFQYPTISSFIGFLNREEGKAKETENDVDISLSKAKRILTQTISRKKGRV